MNQLARRLGTGDAVVVGLSAMIGAGVFSVFAPAAAAAGGGLLIGLAIAALVAFCNAVASTQLAGTYPSSGGTYLYGREVLGPWWGFVAGWGAKMQALGATVTEWRDLPEAAQTIVTAVRETPETVEFDDATKTTRTVCRLWARSLYGVW